MKKITVAVLMGGVSSEHEISLISGQNVFKYLDRKKYRVKSIIISKKGDWSVSSREMAIDKALKGVDVVFNALHGEYGEDGRIQGLLESFSVKYTGSGILASALGMDKVKSRELFNQQGLHVPGYIVLEKATWFKKIYHFLSDRKKSDIFKKFKKLVIKPSCLGSSVGVSIIENKDKKGLDKAIKKVLKRCSTVIIEEYISGREMTCGVLDNVKAEKHFVLPVTEIIPPPGRFFDYEVKYDGSTQEITPARIDRKLAKRIQEAARLAHRVLGCRGYSRTDFIVKNNKIYVLEINTLPGLTKESLLPKAAREAGIEFSELLDIIIKNALQGLVV